MLLQILTNSLSCAFCSKSLFQAEIPQEFTFAERQWWVLENESCQGWDSAQATDGMGEVSE